MVERRICSFCGHEIEPGTGRMYVRKDGTVFQFCASKCYKNMIELRRIPRRTTWTAQYYREKEAKLRSSGGAQKIREELAEDEEIPDTAREGMEIPQEGLEGTEGPEPEEVAEAEGPKEETAETGEPETEDLEEEESEDLEEETEEPEEPEEEAEEGSEDEEERKE
ncbi:MAG: 50S ribosomal protein L24e [Methanomassiliicoccales archaeon]